MSTVADPQGAARSRMELGWAALACALLALVALWTPLTRLGRETLSPADALQELPLTGVDPSWRPGNPAALDVAVRHHAAHELARARLARGEMPVWDPASGFGAPLWAHPDSAPLSPFTWLHWLLPLDRAALLSAFVKLALAGFFTYAFLRSIRLAPLACAFGAAAFELSGTMIEHLARPLSAVALAWPAGLWVLERLVTALEGRGARTGRRLDAPGHALALAAVVAFALSAGDLGAAAWVFLAWFLYAAARAWTARKRVGLTRFAAQAGLVTLLAALVCAVWLVPCAEYLLSSRQIEDRLAGGSRALPIGRWVLAAVPGLGSASVAVFSGALVLLCALLAPLAVRGSRRFVFFGLLALGWFVLAHDVLGALRLVESVPLVRLLPVESGQPVFQLAVAASAAFFVQRIASARPSAHALAAGTTAAVAVVFLFALQAGARALVLATWRQAPDPESRATLAAALDRSLSLHGAWLAAGVACLALAWIASDRRLRIAALAGSVAACALPALRIVRDVQTTTPNSLVDPRTPALAELASEASSHRFAVLGETPLPGRSGALAGIGMLAGQDGLGIARVERLRETLFESRAAGSELAWASRRALDLFGIERVLARDAWPAIDTLTGFAASVPAGEYATLPIVPDLEVELDFRLPDERASAIRVCFETGGRPLLQNIGLELVDRGSGEQLAVRILSPDFQNPNTERRVFATLAWPRLADWRTRRLRLVVRSNDGIGNTAWSLVARRDWLRVVEEGLWRHDGVHAAPCDVEHPLLADFAARQLGKTLEGTIAFDLAWNAEWLREDGAIGPYRVLALEGGTRPFRTVSIAWPAADEDDALRAVCRPAFDPARCVVIEGLEEDARQDTLAADADAPVQVVSELDRAVRLRTTRARPGWLVTSQPWYPGWRARVNGVEEPILRANHAFGAVELGAGTSEIELVYEPASVRIGLWVSIGALAVLALWIRASRTAPALSGAGRSA